MKKYLTLTKIGITLMVTLVSASAYVVAADTFSLKLFIPLVIGTSTLAAASSVFNQLLEIKNDRLMKRTSKRPLVRNEISPKNAAFIGSTLLLCGLYTLWKYTNPLASLIGISIFVGYILIYTPLKKKTSIHILLGAIAGASPPLIGWSVAKGKIEVGGIILFAILFLWQIPHVIAITYIHWEDYKKVGIATLNPYSRFASFQATLYSALLLPVILLSVLFLELSFIYLWIATIATIIFTLYSWNFYVKPTTETAKKLFTSSLVYISIIMVAIIVDNVI